ncbi:MAG: hypothetical protein Q9209_003607 [Squamulea sp. 1 TL-2023]
MITDPEPFVLSEQCVRCSGPSICEVLADKRKEKIKREPEEAIDLPVAPISKQDGAFPFMRLPPELRRMVYQELLVIPWPITVSRPYSFWHPRPHLASITADDGRLRDYCPLATCLILQACKVLHTEATPIYFGANTFNLEDLDALSFFLTKLKPESRRSITSLIVRYEGGHPARSMKLLRGCVSLRHLSLDCTWGTIRYGDFPWYSIYGLNDLLRLRGIQKLVIQKPKVSEDVIFFTQARWEKYWGNWQEFVQALEILKQPYTHAAIRQQDRKDYPPEKARRTFFGRANVVTRAEKRWSSNSGIVA